MEKILVFEYFSGGGWPEFELPAELVAEGRAMLDAVLADLRAWGQVSVTTTCDARLAERPPLADRVEVLKSAFESEELIRLAEHAGVVLLIAPETDDLLEHLTLLIEAAGSLHLNSLPAATCVAADKWQCYQLFSEYAMRTPPTRAGWSEDPARAAAWLGYPLVVKPRYGAGSQGISLVESPAELSAALARAGRWPLLQRYVEGQHASVSLLACDTAVAALSLNGQEIEIGPRLTYRGGLVPLAHPQAAEALALAERAAGLLPGLRGYVGIDMVLAPQGPTLIEINPRLTSAYIGLRRVTQSNLAQLMWDAALEGRLPRKFALQGTARFHKDGRLG